MTHTEREWRDGQPEGTRPDEGAAPLAEHVPEDAPLVEHVHEDDPLAEHAPADDPLVEHVRTVDPLAETAPDSDPLVEPDVTAGDGQGPAGGTGARGRRQRGCR